MPDFIYSAMNAEGKKREGRIEADSIEEATRILNDQGYLPLYIRRMEEDAKSFKKKARPVQSADSSEQNSKKDDDVGWGTIIFILAAIALVGWLLWLFATGMPRLAFWLIASLFWIIYIPCGGIKMKQLTAILLVVTVIWGWWAHNGTSSSDNRKKTVASADKSSVSTPKKGKPQNGEIVFITNISNSYGRISPAMSINFICGKEDQKLDDMISTFYKENKKLEYKKRTENYDYEYKEYASPEYNLKKSHETQDRELRFLDFQKSVKESCLGIGKYIEENPQGKNIEYLGNQQTLTDVPVGSTFYCWAIAEWNNGKAAVWWAKKIVVKPGKNEVNFVNDITAIQAY